MVNNGIRSEDRPSIRVRAERGGFLKGKSDIINRSLLSVHQREVIFRNSVPSQRKDAAEGGVGNLCKRGGEGGG